MFNGFLELEGKTRVKDDTSGLITTGIIKIPKLKLMSGLSIRLGAQANPVVGKGLPARVEKKRNNKHHFDLENGDLKELFPIKRKNNKKTKTEKAATVMVDKTTDQLTVDGKVATLVAEVAEKEMQEEQPVVDNNQK